MSSISLVHQPSFLTVCAGWTQNPTESKVRSPKWPHPLPALTHGRKRNHVVHVYSCHHLAARREDCSLNFKLRDHPHQRLLVPTGRFQDIFSSVSSSSLMLPPQEVRSDGLKVVGSMPHRTGKRANQANMLGFVFR